MYEFTEKGWLKHVIFHPVEGFEDLRWKKKGSIKISLIIVLGLFISMIARSRLMGFQFNMSYEKLFNVIPLLAQSVVFFFAWVIGNWAVCTLFNGEGTLKRILIFSAYSLVPYIIGTYVSVFFSNFLIQDESIWVNCIYYIGLGWSIILMIQAMRAVHQYSFGMTLLSIVATIFAMLIILFLAILLLSLFQQVYVFFYSIYTEIAYRIRG